MLTLPSSLNATSASPLPGPAAGSTHGLTAAEPGQFARELNRHASEAPKSQYGADKPSAHETQSTPPPTPQGKQGNSAPAQAAAKASAHDAAPRADAQRRSDDTQANTADAADATDKSEDAPATSADAKSADPAADLSAWLAALQRGDAPADAKRTLQADGGDSQGDDAQGDYAQGGQAARQLAPFSDAGTAVRAAAADAKDGGRTHAAQRDSGGSFEAHLAAATRAAPDTAHDKTASAALALRDDTPAPQLVASAPPSTIDTPSAATLAPLDAPIAAPVHSDDFAPALATQVSILARDGVHEARLHLNPAETGPIAVRIEVVAAQARVDFTAEQAATRSAIEASLPGLAAALRDAGLTLTGGGVFQQSAHQQRGEPGDGPASRGARRAGREAEAAPVVRRVTVRAGGVDLYA